MNYILVSVREKGNFGKVRGDGVYFSISSRGRHKATTALSNKVSQHISYVDEKTPRLSPVPLSYGVISVKHNDSN